MENRSLGQNLKKIHDNDHKTVIDHVQNYFYNDSFKKTVAIFIALL